MSSISNKGQDLSRENMMEEINKLQKDFTIKVNELRDKYFIEGKGLTVIGGNENFAVGFAIDYGALIDRSSL